MIKEGVEKKQFDQDDWELLSPVQKAIRYLADTQVTEEGPGLPYWIGSWPMEIDIYWKKRKISLPEVTTMSALVIHALSVINDQSASVLGLSSDDLDLVSGMRRKTVQFLQRLEIKGHGALDGSYGYWPPRLRKDSISRKIFNTYLRLLLRSREYNGILAPLHMPKIPVQYQVWPDADDTAFIYTAYLDAAVAEGLPKPDLPAERLFGTWRDTGNVPVLFPKWREKPTGLFLTWFAGTPEQEIVNDIDLNVNANVLSVLGRYGRLDLPGVEEAIYFITKVVEDGLYKNIKDISLYYPDNLSFQYAVLHAYRYGGVAALGPVAQRLADEVEKQAVVSHDGQVYWEGETPHYSTSLALLALAYSGRGGPLFDGGYRWLAGKQNPQDGSWPEAMFCWTFEKKVSFYWRSPVLPSALALTALCRCQLEQAGLSTYPMDSESSSA